jgi:hypothetical protein
LCDASAELLSRLDDPDLSPVNVVWMMESLGLIDQRRATVLDRGSNPVGSRRSAHPAAEVVTAVVLGIGDSCGDTDVSQGEGLSCLRLTARVIARGWVAKEAPMRVFVAGATRALGTELVPQLAAAGHEVIGMSRLPAKTTRCGPWAPGRLWPTRSIPTLSAVPWPSPSPR